MKRLLFLTVAVAISSLAMAQWNRNLPKSTVLNQLKTSACKSSVTKTVKQGDLISLSQIKAEAAKASRRAGEDNGINGISQEAYTVSNMVGLLTMNMFSEIKYYAEGDKLNLGLYGLDYMEGTIHKGQANALSSYQADSVTFNLGTVAFEGESGKYFYGGATVAITKDDITSERNDKTTFGAYYFAEEDELYIPAQALSDFIAVFKEGETTPVFGTLIADLDILPASYLKQYISKATWTASDLGYNQSTGKPVVTPMEGGEAQVLVTNKGFYVIGIYPKAMGMENTWVFLEASEDGTQATISEDQYLGGGEYYIDESRTTTAEVVFTPVSILTDFSNWAEDYASVFLIENDEESQTTTIASDGLTSVSIYGFSDDDDMTGPWLHMTDVIITITYEPIGDDEGTTVKTSAEGYATFFDSQSAYTLPTGLQAQIVTGVTEGKLNFQTLTDGVIPQNTAVMLYSGKQASQTFTLEKTESQATYSGTNLLRGSDEATTTTADGDCYFYKLTFGSAGSSLENTFGWFWGAANGGAFQIEGHKAWLAVPKSAGVRYFINDDTNGIKEIGQLDNLQSDDWYDLSGRKIVNGQSSNRQIKKGIYVKNGKKFVNM